VSQGRRTQCQVRLITLLHGLWELLLWNRDQISALMRIKSKNVHRQHFICCEGPYKCELKLH
jgi:hypothetical protein